jgi:glycosyltransferase involved in cell wall biosynthesis
LQEASRLNIIAGSLLLVLPVPFRRDGETLSFESQACNGLNCWADNFARVIVACPLEPADVTRQRKSSETYLPIDSIPARDRIEFVPLPWGHGVGEFARQYRRTRRLLADKIRRSQFLSFAIGGLTGNWAAVAGLAALRQGREFSVWTDSVEYEVVKKDRAYDAGRKTLARKIKNHLVVSPLMKQIHRYIVSRSALGLFHGRDCFDAYAPYCRNPQLVHNIHLKPGDQISPQHLQTKIHRVLAGDPLCLVYAGRATEIKGPMEWLGVLAELRNQGIPFRATWLGDGPLLAKMRIEADRLNLERCCNLAGHIADRAELLRCLQSSDVFVFCHQTPESPRCLIEGLISGNVLAGFDSAYPRDLLEGLAGRLLVPQLDTAGLAARIAELHFNRAELAELIGSCAGLGARYSDQAVFRHRSDLIKTYLKWGPGCDPVDG